jgi:hypothetical protein
MADNPVEKILEEARALSPEDQKKLIRLLLAGKESDRPHKTIEQLAAEQSKKPADFDELLVLGDFWPEDEKVDDFLVSLREWRRDEVERRVD